jgi:hypothetical protein
LLLVVVVASMQEQQEEGEKNVMSAEGLEGGVSRGTSRY